MSSTRAVTISLEPLGESFVVGSGTLLRDVLFAHGVEFPCGGHGKCRRCRVKLLAGSLPPTDDEKRILSSDEIGEGWRLACRCSVRDSITLEIGQWETAVLADDTDFNFTPRIGYAAAVDVGTTTLVAQLVDLESGNVLGVRSALNPQTVHGSDVMSRVQTALSPEGSAALTDLIRKSVGGLLAELAAFKPVNEVVLVGNTVMHHIFCGIDLKPLSEAPFHAVDDGLQTFRAADLGWDLASNPTVQFLPCLGGFVGSDILAGIIASGIDHTSDPVVLLDLGTNGEIVAGSGGRILCASTAAGPAFEGGRISIGMRAATGAVAEARLEDDELVLHVLGNADPRGICGSGLVDIVACGLSLGRIHSSGRLVDGTKRWALDGPLTLLQRDIRELQLAKAAVAAGVQILLRQLGVAPAEIGRIYLAGAFGNYVNRESARRIGLVNFDIDRISPVGNTALLGAKLVLFRTEPDEREFSALRERITHVPLADDPAFEDTYVEAMTFPAPQA